MSNVLKDAEEAFSRACAFRAECKMSDDSVLFEMNGHKLTLGDLSLVLCHLATLKTLNMINK